MPLRPLLILLIGAALCAGESVTVLAAASLSDALGEVASAYAAATGVRVVCSFSASSAAAKQIENGAPADLFISADLAWCDYLDQRRLLQPGSRRELLRNRLVIIAPRERPFAVQAVAGFDFPGAFAGRLALGDPAAVPAGRYCRQAFARLGWWEALQPRLAPAPDVRAALRLVETGECAAGVVYASDAQRSAAVAVLADIPAGLHDPVVYPAALTVGAAPAAAALLAHLAGPAAQAVFARHGFAPPGAAR